MIRARSIWSGLKVSREAKFAPQSRGSVYFGPYPQNRLLTSLPVPGVSLLGDAVLKFLILNLRSVKYARMSLIAISAANLHQLHVKCPVTYLVLGTYGIL
jgi:hypothetical protein